MTILTHRAAIILRLWLGVLSLLLCLPPPALSAFPDADTQPSEYQVEAAFLLNFTKFVDWPPAAFASAEAPFNLCVVGQDPFGDSLDRVVSGETVNGRKLTVIRSRRAPAPKSCQIVFVPATEGDAAQILKALNPEVLTVGEGEGFLRAGGMIGFVIENRRVRFSVNLNPAERGQLKLSSKLLSVARSVQR